MFPLRHSLVVTSLVLAGACASARPATSPAPQPAPTPTVSTPPVVSPPVVVTAPAAAPVERMAAVNWQLLDPDLDKVPGIGLERAYREQLAGKKPARTVVVAVIDGGVDTAHVDLRPNLWKNSKEIAGNGKDDDNNGFVDDVYGWNFIGGADGRDVHWDTFEVTRLFVLCQKKDPQVASMPCDSIAKSYNEKKNEAEGTYQNIKAAGSAFNRAVAILKSALRTDSLTVSAVHAFTPRDQQSAQAKAIYEQFNGQGSRSPMIDEALDAYESQVKYGYNASFDPRSIVGDDPRNTADHRYGNRDVTGPDAKHGTHVAGIIGAVRGNGIGVEGAAGPDAVRIMAVRAVPDGDERDKDIANAVRYAVDNGAQVINMSFGKAWSPHKGAVDSAMMYASEKGVLLVHAAGNEGEDLSHNRNFPNRATKSGATVPNWIEVGALSWRGGDTIAVNFSNYGQAQVDVFAPGEDILSTIPGGGIERLSGTSMAAPVVTGLAAVIMAYYPDLTAADVRRAIVESARKIDGKTLLPGDDSGKTTAFSSLSVTGGIVNAPGALKLAAQISAAKKTRQ